MPRTSKTIKGGSSSRQQDSKTSNRGQSRSRSGSGQSRSGSGESQNSRSASSSQAASTRGDSRSQSPGREETFRSARSESRQSDSGFHNEHYRAGFDAGRAYYHHYDRESGSGESQRRASDNNLNGPRDDSSRSSGRGRDSDRSAGDYGETVYRSDNEDYSGAQRGDGNLGRSRNDLDEIADTDRSHSGRSSTRDREADVSENRSGRGSRSRASARSGRADVSES